MDGDERGEGREVREGGKVGLNLGGEDAKRVGGEEVKVPTDFGEDRRGYVGP